MMKTSPANGKQHARLNSEVAEREVLVSLSMDCRTRHRAILLVSSARGGLGHQTMELYFVLEFAVNGTSIIIVYKKIVNCMC